MVIQVLRKKSEDDSKEIAKLKYENEDLQCCLMSSTEGVDSLKKQIQELKKNNKHSASSEIKSKTEVISLSVAKEEKMKSDIAGLKSSVQELNTKFLETDHQNDALQKSNLSLLKKVDLLKDQVKEQLCKASKAEFEVESFRRYNKDLVQKLKSLKHNNNNSLCNATTSSASFDNNISNNSYGRHYQGFGSPNVTILYKKNLAESRLKLF